MDDQLEIFLQGPGIAGKALVKVPAKATVGQLIDVARKNGLKVDDEQAVQVWLENTDEPIQGGTALLAAGIQNRSRVQIHTCRRIHVTVNFNNRSEQHPFAPSATMDTVKKWADEKFGLGATDATEYALRVCGSTDVPDEETEVGALAQPGECRACFDLIPKQRVEG